MIRQDHRPARARPRFYILIDAIGEDPRLTSSECLILIWIARHLGKGKRQCFPGYVRLAKLTRLNRITVIRLVKSIEAKGWLEVERAEKGGPQTSNRYRVTPPQEVLERVEKTYTAGGNGRKRREESAETWEDFDGVPEDDAAE